MTLRHAFRGADFASHNSKDLSFTPSLRKRRKFCLFQINVKLSSQELRGRPTPGPFTTRSYVHIINGSYRHHQMENRFNFLEQSLPSLIKDWTLGNRVHFFQQ